MVAAPAALGLPPAQQHFLVYCCRAFSVAEMFVCKPVPPCSLQTLEELELPDSSGLQRIASFGL